jgi:phage-related tail protein
MYDIEIIEANKLIDDIKRDAAATNAKKQQAERDLSNQTARFNEIRSARETDRREIDALQLRIAENEAVREYLNIYLNDYLFFVI